MARNAERPPAQASEPSPESPCVNECVMDPRTGWCTGCQRTIEEIICWPRAGADLKREILARLPARRQGLSR